MSLTPEDWADAALEALADGGPRAIAIEPLARRVGMSKGSFYHHFKGKAQLQDAMLLRFAERATDAVIRQTDARSADPRARLERLSWLVFAPNPEHDRIEAALRAWAGTEAKVAEVLSKVDQRRLAYVRELLVAAGLPNEVAQARAELMYRALIGEFTWTSMGGDSLSSLALRELLVMLQCPPGAEGEPMFALPPDLHLYKRTPDFDQDSVPKGLLGRHNTREGVWGRIVMASGRLHYVVEGGPSWMLEPGVVGIVQPQQWHHVEPVGACRFHVEFLKAQDPAQTS